MKGAVIFSFWLLFLSGIALADDFYADAASGSNAAGNGSPETPGVTVSIADNTAVHGALPGSGFSGAVSTALPPILDSISPESGNRLETLEVVFTGTNFISGVTSVNVGSYITVNSTTVTSSTSLRANLTITAVAATGARDFSVTNSGPGGGTSGNQTFTVKESKAPTITHTPTSPQRSGEQIQVNAVIEDDDSDSVWTTLHYRRGGEVSFTSGMSSLASSFQDSIRGGAVTSRGVEYLYHCEGFGWSDVSAAGFGHVFHSGTSRRRR
jgi:hypothetical protein